MTPAVAILYLVSLVPLSAHAVDAEEVKDRWMKRLDGRAFSATATLRVSYQGTEEIRRLVIWRDDRKGLERVMVRFESPFELKGLGLLYLEQVDRTNDYFIHQPGTGRIRRVPERVAREDSYGVDLEYLGFGVAQLEPTRLVGATDSVLDGRKAIRLEERSVRPDARFETRTIWLSREHMIPLRAEHRKNDRTVLSMSTLEVEVVQGIPTPRRVRFERSGSSHIVDLEIETIDYMTRIPEAFFTTLRLIRER